MKRLKNNVVDFGLRLAEARRRKGLSQRNLAKSIGVSGRMIAYYERQGAHPPAHLVKELCKVLGTSADELLGLKEIRHQIGRNEWTLWKRFKKTETLSIRDKKALFHYLNALLVKNGHSVRSN